MRESDYVDEVLRGVRWKRAHDTVKRELEDHLFDQKAALMADGLPKEEAESKAVHEMGDAVQVAEQYNQVLRPRHDKKMLLLVGGLYLFALAFCVLRHAIDASNDAWIEDALGLMIGPAAFAVGYFVDVRMLIRWGLWVYLGHTAALALLFIASFTWWFPFNLNWTLGGYWLILAPLAYAFLLGSMRAKGLGGSVLCFIAPWILHALTEGTFDMAGRLMLLGACYGMFFVAMRSVPFPKARQASWIYFAALCVIALVPFVRGTYIQRFYFAKDMFGASLVGVRFLGFEAEAGNWVSGVQCLMFLFGWGAFLIVSIPYLWMVWRCVQTGMRKKRTCAQMVCIAVALSLLMQYVCGLSAATGGGGRAWPTPFIDTKPVSMVLNLFQIGLVMSIGRMGTLRVE